MATSEEHNRLTGLAARWLKRNGFGVVATELNCHGSREQPDAIGFRSSASAIIEVKVSCVVCGHTKPNYESYEKQWELQLHN